MMHHVMLFESDNTCAVVKDAMLKSTETIDDKVYGVAIEGTQSHFGQIIHSSTMADCHAYIKHNKLTLSAAEEADKENQSSSKLNTHHH